MSEVLLKIENLNKSFGITHANVNINFELKAGEVRGLAGENGSGKSTLLSQIAGLYGSVDLRGHRSSRASAFPR